MRVAKIITLEGEIFVADYSILRQSAFLEEQYRVGSVGLDGPREVEIRLENIFGPMMRRILDWCGNHFGATHEDEIQDITLSEWEKEFFEVIF